MRTSMALYVLSAVVISTSNQAAVTHKRSTGDENDSHSNPWNSRHDNVETQVWGNGPEDISNDNVWNIKRKAATHIWDVGYEEARDADWRYQNEHVASGHQNRFSKDSRVMHLGTSKGKRELHENIGRTLSKPVHEGRDDIFPETKILTWKTNNRNVGNNKKLNGGRQMSEKRHSTFPISLEIDHEISLRPRDNDDKHSSTNPQVLTNEDQWLYGRDFVNINNEYWYIQEEHPGVAFVLSGVSLVGPHVGLLEGEWLKNTATGEMYDVPWERGEESRKRLRTSY